MTRALILAPFERQQLHRLSAVGDVVYESWLETRRIHDPLELGKRITRENFSILVVESDFVFEELFDEAPNLRFVGICRAALNHVELDAATRHGVCVVNTPGRNAQAVAEHALALMFSLARNIPTAHSYVRSRAWLDPVEPYASMRGSELSERTLGIIGLGAIGQKLAAIVSGLNMRVLVYDPYVADVPKNVRITGLDELLSDSDYVSVHVPLTQDTEGLIDGDALKRMKPSAYVISCSDPAIFQRNALYDSLTNGWIAGAAIDVFESHPISPDNPLLTLDNVILTPHIGGATEETIARHSRMIVDDIHRFLDGVRPVNLVNPEVWTRLE